MKISPRLQISLVAGILITFGLALTLYKNIELGFPLSPGQQQTVWKVESKISFEPIDGPVNISMALPQAQAGWQLFNVASGYMFPTGNFLSSRIDSIVSPTAPVAPTTAIS